ncbi:MAG: hypothetical protein KGD63_08465 [Candidatus Lokiarchaeota archaeon]|nr:hypothetical protein [Candidatus Lokiarchaeota archaeon]
MKKTKLISVFAISFFLILMTSPNISLVQGATDYVGVSVGDEKSWKITVYSAGVMDLFGDIEPITGPMDPTLATILTSDLNLGLGVKVLSISTENTASNGVGYYTVSLNASISATGQSMSLGQIDTVVFDPDEPNYFNNTFSLNEMTPPAIIMPINISWTEVVSDLSSLTEITMPGNTIPLPSFTISARSNGMSINTPTASIVVNSSVTLTLKAFNFTITYDDNGWLNTVSLKYGGAPVVTMEPDAIPGYELIVFFGVSAITGFGLVTLVKKKTKKLRI